MFRLLLLLALPIGLSAQSPADRVRDLLASAGGTDTIKTAIGVTRSGTPIPALLTSIDLDPAEKSPRVLVVAGLDGSRESVDAAMRIWREHDPRISIVPIANPDGWGSGPGNRAGGSPSTGYPPEEPSYLSSTDPERQYLWRWIGLHAPDLVIEIARGDRYQWQRSGSPQLDDLAAKLDAEHPAPAGSLTAALAEHAPADVGVIPALRVEVTRSADVGKALRANFDTIRALGPSSAHQEITKRLARKPLEVARQLADVYGHQLDSVVYIPALGLIGRLRLGALTNDDAPLADVQRIVKPYLDGQSTLTDEPTSSHLPGHLIFGELAKATGDSRYVALAKRAADLGFNDDGSMKESMPFHNEMSDSVFMGCAILAEVGALTGDRRYFDMALRHMRFMQKLDWRDDGLYRHSPLDEAAWGRGNGFPALGLAWALSEIPDGYPGRKEMLADFQKHMRALLPQQDGTGMWHEVIDHPESYRELTATSMIGFAMQRGVSRGWLAADEFNPVITQAWEGVKTRVAADGSLVDVCRSTGKQVSIRAYYDREAILGKDDRGGAMALLFATELAAAEGR